MSDQAHTHAQPHHDHAHAHDQHHHHDEEDTYFIDQLCMVGLSGAFGVICLCLWFGKHFWQAEMLNNLLAENFHLYVLLSGIALTLVAFTRGGILWFQSRDPKFLHAHTHHHHDHDHAPAVEQETHIHEKATHLQTVPPMHDHVHGPACTHDHANGEACTHHEHTHAHDHHGHHHDHDAADHDHGWAPWRYVAILIPIILFMLGLPSRSANLGDAGYEGLLRDFSSIIYEAMPFIVLGVLIAGLLEEFVPQQAITKIVPKNTFLAVAIGGLLGLVFPMCECGIIVVMKRLLRKGLPLSVCVAYMLAGPVINVVVMTSTYVAFSGYKTPENAVLSGPIYVVAWRVGLSYVIALVTALVVDWQWQRHGTRLLHPSVLRGLRQASDDNDKSLRPMSERVNNITQTALNDFVDIMAFLVLGACLAAGGKYLIRESNIQTMIQETPAIAILLMMGIAILFCLCSEADAFVAANFPLYWPDASKLAFLVLGPMLDLKLLLMYTRVFRPRLIATIVACLVVQVFLYSSVVGYFFGIEHPPEQKKVIMPPNVESYLLGIGTGPDPLSQLAHFGVAFRRSDARVGRPVGYKDLYESAADPMRFSYWLEDVKVVEVRGQYDPQANDHFFMLARMKIACCASDGRWLSIPVVSRDSIKDLKKGDWVKVIGSVEYRKTGPNAYTTVLMVQSASEVVRSNPDTDPYVK